MENSGLLLYNGRFNEKHDFIALEIQEGQVVFKYSTGINSLYIHNWTLSQHLVLEKVRFYTKGNKNLSCYNI